MSSIKHTKEKKIKSNTEYGIFLIRNKVSDLMYGPYGNTDQALREAVKRNKRNHARSTYTLYRATRNRRIVPIGELNRAFGTDDYSWRLFSTE